MKITKYVSKDCRCPKCNGMAAIAGTMTYKIPMGFGCSLTARFQIDYLQYKGWYGECMDCNTKILFYKSKKMVTRFPKSINNKLKKLSE